MRRKTLPALKLAVGLGAAPKREHRGLFDLFVLLDETIVVRNARRRAR